jgi:WD40 repeat protein
MAAAKKSPMKDWITDIKFSPDQRYIAVGSNDKNIYIFAFPKVEIHCQFDASSSPISHMDWSIDSRYLRSNDGANELFYYDVATSQHEKNGVTTLRDTEWNTSNCPITWASQGIWNSNMDGSEIFDCDRS